MDPVAIDPRADALIAPFRQAWADARARLPARRDLAVRLGDVALWALDGEGIVLDARLAAEGTHHPMDAGDPRGLDRWRRALACLLEAEATAALPEGRGPAWVKAGLAIHAAGRAAPGLGLDLVDLAAGRGGDLGAWPRGGGSVIAAWDRSGDGWSRGLRAWTEGVTPADVLDAARAVLSAEGVGGVADAPRRPAVDVPATLGSWCLTRVAVPAHARGGRIDIEGDGVVDPIWAAAGAPLHGVAVSGPGGCRLMPSAGGPLGAWELVTAEGFGQVFGARGLVFEFRADGRLQVVFADAFVGGFDALPLADRLGTSGVARARWRVAGPAALSVHDIDTSGVTMHGKGAERFAMPMGEAGLAGGLRAMAESPWRWTRRDDRRLVLSGRIGGGPVTLVLAAPAVDA